MAEEALRRLLEQIDGDEEFRAALLADPEAALDDAGLSETELVALGAADEDALRRLAGVETVAFGLGAETGFAKLRPTMACFKMTIAGCMTISRDCPQPAGPASGHGGEATGATGVNLDSA